MGVSMDMTISERDFAEIGRNVTDLLEKAKSLEMQLNRIRQDHKPCTAKSNEEDEVSLDDLLDDAKRLGLMLKGFQKELWEVILTFPKPAFTLQELYKRAEALRPRHPAVKEFEATIRGTIQKLRDAGYVKFFGNGSYLRLL